MAGAVAELPQSTVWTGSLRALAGLSPSDRDQLLRAAARALDPFSRILVHAHTSGSPALSELLRSDRVLTLLLRSGSYGAGFHRALDRMFLRVLCERLLRVDDGRDWRVVIGDVGVLGDLSWLTRLVDLGRSRNAALTLSAEDEDSLARALPGAGSLLSNSHLFEQLRVS